MTLLHGDFCNKNIDLIGTPDQARAAVAADRFLRSIVSGGDGANRVNADLVKSVPGDLPPARPMVDPVVHPRALVMAVRATPATESKLQRLCAALGLTFWGEAIAVVVEFCAANPGHVSLSDLRARAPVGLMGNKGAACEAGSAPTRGVQTPLSVEAMAFVDAIARRERVGRAVAATLILHRNIGPVLAAFTAPEGCA